MRILYTCALALILGGCAASGQKVTQQQIDQVQAGRTTTAQLIDLFGEPNTRVYNSDGSQILAWGYAYVGFAGIGTEVQSVSMIIGPDGTVQGYSRSGTNPSPTPATFSKPAPIAPVGDPQNSALYLGGTTSRPKCSSSCSRTYRMRSTRSDTGRS